MNLCEEGVFGNNKKKTLKFSHFWMLILYNNDKQGWSTYIYVTHLSYIMFMMEHTATVTVPQAFDPTWVFDISLGRSYSINTRAYLVYDIIAGNMVFRENFSHLLFVYYGYNFRYTTPG